MALPDLFKKGQKVWFVGTAVTESSKNVDAYYATHGNKFYEIIHQIGLTKRLISPQNYKSLISDGIGLTDLVKNRTGLDNALKAKDFDVNALKVKMKKHKIPFVCFNGKLSAAYFINGNNKTSKIKYGLQEYTYGNTKIFVVPSSARTANKYWDDKHWEDLSKLIKAESN